jgi:hypothetical protein
MTSLRFVLSCLGTAVLAALIGAGVGFRYGQCDLVDPDRPIDLFAASQSRYTSYVFTVRKGGSDEANEIALRAYLGYLDERSRNSGTANPNLYSFDKAIALIRLSEIAQRRGATADSAQLATEADAWCSSAGIRKCSANQLLGTVRERDRRGWAGSAR